MRRQLATVVLAIAAMTAATGGATAADQRSDPPNAQGWYLALGDSYAAGYQAGQGDDRDGGYVGGVLESVQLEEPKTRLVNLACSGATTTSMIHGDEDCSYEEGTQLAQAVEFLHAHARSTRLVTIDIGGNDIAGCAWTGLQRACTDPALATLRTNLPVILTALRQAAGPDVEIVVLNYPDPFLAFWLLDTPGTTADDGYRALAIGSVELLGTVNAIIAASASAVGADTADVAEAFSTRDFETQAALPGYPGTVPLNVARVCQWTTMCTLRDFHPNDAGYAVLADAVEARLG